MQKLAFYCVCERNHFLGLVALVNSLRLLGHNEMVYVLDSGLDSWQRAVLAQDREVTVVSADGGRHPALLKAVLPLACPTQTMVVVDVDVIFTERVDSLVERVTTSGKPLFFPDCWADKFEPAWECLGFGPPVPHTYLTSGHFVLRAESSHEFLKVWEQGLERLATDPALAGLGLAPEQNPFRFRDQDVLNALIGPVVPLDSFITADAASAAYFPFWDVRIVDPERLLVEAADGSRPILLHHFLSKPWLGLVAPNTYSQLMTRLLRSDDVALRVTRGRVPYQLRSGAAARRYVASRLWVRRTRERLNSANPQLTGSRSSAHRG